MILPANPFEAALREGAGLTYLAMARSGMERLFDPLPRSSDGLGLASLMLGRGQGPHGDALCSAMLALGLDPTAPCVIPQNAPALRNSTQALGLESAPLASLAMASGDPGFIGFWNGLDRAGLLAIAPSALPLACQADRHDAMRALLGAGADPNAVDAKGVPVASRARSAAALKLLIDAGADLRATVPAASPSGEPRTVHGFFLADASLSSEPKAMRMMAVEWAVAHPATEAVDGAELAAAAFKALDEGNRDSARGCVLALGARALAHRDDQGFSLMDRACQAENHAETTRLLDFGADPFDIAPDGKSPWGRLLAQAYSSSSHSTPIGRAATLCREIASKRKYKAIPWTRRGPGGHALIETLIAACPIADFLGFLHRAKACGFDSRAPLSNGIDVSSALLLRAAFQSSWTGPRAAARDPIQMPQPIVCDFLLSEPPSLGSASSKSAFAEAFFNMAAQNIRERYRHASNPGFFELTKLPSGLFSPSVRELLTNSGNRYSAILDMTEALLRESFELRGGLGLPMLDFDAMGDRELKAIPVHARETLFALHERASLGRACSTAPSTSALSGPSRL